MIALVLISVSSEALAQSDWTLCKAVDADHLVIPACTRLIDAGNLVQNDRALAYSIRGAAHWRQRDLDAAIADESKAIELDPHLASAFVARSSAYGDEVRRSSDSGRNQGD
jgi:hypothetical protein